MVGSETPASALIGPEVLELFDGDAVAGLTQQNAAQRLARYGPNELPSAPPTPRWRRLLAQFVDPVVYLLLAAIAVSVVAWGVEGATGLPLDAIAIAVIVVANALIGYMQESKAEQAVAALQVLTRTEATVIRDGRTLRMAAAGLVPGDLVLLSDGDVIPADSRLIEANALQVAEAAVTGESAPVIKSIEAVAPDTAIGDRVGMVFSGTAVVSGRARAIVTATGRATEVGRIATLLEETEQEPTPLQREIDFVGRVLGISVIAIAVVVVATLIVVEDLRTAEELVSGLLIGVSLAVAAVPEGLPAVLSVVLALGVQRMSSRNALVKRLASVETLGSSTIICSDKTGTLTRNQMMARRLVIPSGEVELTGSGYDPTGRLLLDGAELADDTILDEVQWALIAGGLASDASISENGGRFEALGDPTEAALLAAQTQGRYRPRSDHSSFRAQSRDSVHPRAQANEHDLYRSRRQRPADHGGQGRSRSPARSLPG